MRGRVSVGARGRVGLTPDVQRRGWLERLDSNKVRRGVSEKQGTYRYKQG